ncbi:hypothetical protein F503_00355 [Ophiostoma piceae UAMH 11346]|uniref:Uncharacterized protein n=1 Tax=Ophiostoma piceae (strain UAMH 11346) TaxID=1262450 RepID=S3CM92_OPHP1|nr:hypothetical protein F503_00355 [Ophiostoma piceae UAMH 11346]
MFLQQFRHGMKKRKAKTDDVAAEVSLTPASQARAAGKMLLSHMRHRPGFALSLILAAVVTLAVAHNRFASRESEPGIDSRHKSATTKGRDPIDDLPLFSEVREMPDPLYAEFVGWHGDEYEAPPKPSYKEGHSPKDSTAEADRDEEHSQYDTTPELHRKTAKTTKPSDDIPDPFLLLTRLDKAGARAILPRQHNTATRTPLFIGFTRNWPLLLQCVASYMAAGWPARDIYVVENTGTMGANKAGRLSLQNPFFANHTQLVESLGVNIIETPTLFSFAQLQNFYLYTAQQMGWPHFFWSHQDAVVFSEAGYVDTDNDDVVGVSVEDGDGVASPALAFLHYKRSLHHRALATLKILTRDSDDSGDREGKQRRKGRKWATHFFDYDRLTLVNVEAYMDVGAWDTHIPYYATDCDMYLRLKWAGYWQGMIAPAAGRIYDVASVLDDLAVLFGIPGVRASVGGRGARGINRKLRGLDAEPGTVVEDIDDIVYVVRQMQKIKNEGYDAREVLEPIDSLSDDDSDSSYSYSAANNPIEVSDRNSWQRRQRGGQGEPFYRDPDGFETGILIHIASGRRVFGEKWGHRGCDLDPMGIQSEDAWQLERDWDDSSISFGGGW